MILLLFLAVSPWARTHLYLGNELADKNHFAYLDSISLGCMSAIIMKKLTFPKWLNWSFFIVGFSMVIVVLVFKGFVYKSGIADLGLNITLLSLGVSFILFWLHERHHSGRERSFKLLNWLKNMGVYSYEIYLSHMLIVIFGVRLFKGLELGECWLIPFSLLIILGSYLLGKILFLNFSEPINLWLRKKWTST